MSYKSAKKVLPKSRLHSGNNPAERTSNNDGVIGGHSSEPNPRDAGGNPGDDGDR